MAFCLATETKERGHITSRYIVKIIDQFQKLENNNHDQVATDQNPSHRSKLNKGCLVELAFFYLNTGAGPFNKRTEFII